MRTSRLEAFSDGVMAILITIMVLDLKAPDGTSLSALGAVLPGIGVYALSFVSLGIYWNNHHHLIYATERVNGTVLWANLHLFFWLSLVPFATRWVTDSGVAVVPTALYGGVFLLAAVAYTVLQRAIIACQADDSLLVQAVGSDFKGLCSLLLYALSIPLAFVSPWIAVILFVCVAGMWLVPDRRIESRLAGMVRDG